MCHVTLHVTCHVSIDMSSDTCQHPVQYDMTCLVTNSIDMSPDELAADQPWWQACRAPPLGMVEQFGHAKEFDAAKCVRFGNKISQGLF